MNAEDMRDLLDQHRISNLFVASASGIKRPRQYAAEICAERSRTKRRRMLEAVPDDFRPLTETHVRNAFALRAYAIRPTR